MKDTQKAIIYLVLTILIWSTAPAIAAIALEELNNLQLLFYTSITSTLSLFIMTTIQKKLRIIKTFSIKDFINMFWMGTIGIFLYYILLFESFSIAPAGQANVVNYLWPIFIVIFSIPILKEKFNYRTIAAVLTSFIGALVVFTQGDLSSFKNEFTAGYILAALAAICYGFFSVMGKKLHYEKYTSMLLYSFFATLLIIPTTLYYSNITIPQNIGTMIAILILGGISNSITFVFWFKALKLGHTHKTANAIYSVPFLALIWTYLFNGEPIELFSIIGLILIICGITIQMKNKH